MLINFTNSNLNRGALRGWILSEISNQLWRRWRPLL